MTPHTSPIESRPIWDRFVRVFHWSLVTCVMVNYFVLDDGKLIHEWLGYTASALVLARVVWGFVGSSYARFSEFFPTPRRLWRHIGQLLRGKTDFHWGHNPLGALMMLCLMSLVLALGVTGWMQTLDAYWGDEWMQNLHQLIGNVLIGMVTAHALAAIVMGRLERTSLIRAMITGIKNRRT